MEDTQQGLRSGALSYLNLQDDEIMLRHAYKVIHDRLEDA